MKYRENENKEKIEFNKERKKVKKKTEYIYEFMI